MFNAMWLNRSIGGSSHEPTMCNAHWGVAALKFGKPNISFPSLNFNRIFERWQNRYPKSTWEIGKLVVVVIRPLHVLSRKAESE